MLMFVAEQARGVDPDKGLSQYMLKFWNKKDGLPQNSANAVLQTRDGYIWTGTQEGLVRFDGVQFTLFDKKNTEAIKNNFIATLAEDSGGVLWMGTWGGLVKMERGAFTFYGEAQGLTNEPVRALLIDGHALWIGTDGRGLFHYENSRFRNYTTADGLSSNHVLALCKDAKGYIWMGTDGGGLSRYDGKSFQAFTTRNGLSHNTVRSLLADSSGCLWIGTWGGGLNRLDNGTFGRVSSVPSDALITTIFSDRHGSLWIGTDAHGLYRLRGSKSETLTVRDGLPLNVIMSVCEDREGSVWIGTGGGGLGRISDCSFYSCTTRNGLPHDMIWSVYEEPDGTLWFGTDGGGVARMSRQTITVLTTRDGLAHNVVTAIYRDRKGDMWFGTRVAGLCRYAAGRFTLYPEIAAVSSNTVRCMTEDAEGCFWVGTQNGLVQLRNGRVAMVYNTGNSLPNNIVRTLLAGSDSSLWIGTNEGFHRYYHGAIHTWNIKNGLGSNIVIDFYEDQERVLWIGTYGGGINRFKDGRVTAITTAQGLHDDGVFSILDDRRGHLWMSSNNGVFRVSLQELNAVADGKISKVTCTVFGEAEGMGSAECNTGQPSGFRASDGRLWFPTITGAAVVDPGRIIENTFPPPVIIERVITDGKFISTSDYPSQPDAIRFEPGTERVEFHYTGLSYLAPEKVRFRYRLEGFDSEWIDAGSRRVAYYTNLSHGRYIFRVQACNNSGVWNDDGAVLRFYQKPFIYQTVWFYLFCGLIISGSAIGLYRFRVKQLRKRQTELEELVRIKTMQVEAQKKDLESALENLKTTQMQLVQSAKMSSLGQLVAGMAHEINNPITVINGYLPLLAQYIDLFYKIKVDPAHEEQLHDSLSEADYILKSCTEAVERIKKIIFNLRSFSRLDEAEYKQADLHENLESTVSLFIPNYERHVIIHRQYASMPPFMCYPGQLNQVFMNLLINAAEAIMERNRNDQREKGNIWISTELIQAGSGMRKARVTIRDDGTGIPANIRDKIFDPFFTTKDVGSGMGLGLSISYGIVQKHKGIISVNPDVTDGTEIIVDIPMD